MGCYIILFLLLCRGGCGVNQTWGNAGCGCIQPRKDADCARDERGRDCGCDKPERVPDCRPKPDCGCDKERERERENGCGMMPPPWTRSSYANGDTCGCEEA